jgi:predicted nucleic acid-binding protein
MSRIYWDTMLFVYWLENHQEYAARVQTIFTRMEARHDKLCTSTFALGELLVGPYRVGASDVARKIQEFFRTSEVGLIPFTEDVADLYAQIRADHRVSPADAIHLACAGHFGVDLFLTNDHRLIGKVIPGIQFVAAMDADIL